MDKVIMYRVFEESANFNKGTNQYELTSGEELLETFSRQKAIDFFKGTGADVSISAQFVLIDGDGDITERCDDEVVLSTKFTNEAGERLHEGLSEKDLTIENVAKLLN